MQPIDALTDEQRAVVHHGDGPAVVRAVPGAGKTTALIHRLRYLVDERDVSPDRILTCSFSRATVRTLRSGLHELGVRGVDTRTLHALGLSLLQRAKSRSHPLAEADPSPVRAARILARRALAEFARKCDLDTTELGISATELIDQIAAWKQQLAYPENDGSADSAPPHAQTATHENDDFLVLYRSFEAHRRKEGWLTYPDMLREAWEALQHDASLREHCQQSYRYVLVDEFQDVSRVQFLLLDLLTAVHRNYMVIGDADQCIYNWRGADPSFLLSFRDRYDADEYVLTDSFRLPAGPLTVAGAAIDADDHRRPKPLHLTRGFVGHARLLEAADEPSAAENIAGRIEALQQEKFSLRDIVVLVRTYAQTPTIERALIDRSLPYRIHGNKPFYRRREVQTLLRYLYWAVLERQLRRKGSFDHPNTASQYADRFAHILKIPNRYVQHARIDQVVQDALAQARSALDVLRHHLPSMHEKTADRVEDFLDVAETLLDRLDEPAQETLEWLIDAIDYERALQRRSAFSEWGEARIRTARALVQFAAPHDSAPALLQAVRALVHQRKKRDATTPAVDLRSIHRAKGEEWPVVFVPGCTEGTLPLDVGANRTPNVEEERRLFFVAATRAREHLYLATDDPENRSRFLSDADVSSRFRTCDRLQCTLATDPANLTDDDLLHLCRSIIELDLARYFKRWWRPSSATANSLRSRLAALQSSIAEAQTCLSDYEQAQAAYESDFREAHASARKRVASLREIMGTAPLLATNETPDTYYPNNASFTFDWVADNSQIGIFWNGTQVASLDPLESTRFDVGTLLDLPWSSMIGRFEGLAENRTVLSFSIDWSATEANVIEEATASRSPPDPPTPLTRGLTSDTFQAGYRLLCDVLSAPVSPG